MEASAARAARRLALLVAGAGRDTTFHRPSAIARSRRFISAAFLFPPHRPPFSSLSCRVYRLGDVVPKRFSSSSSSLYSSEGSVHVWEPAPRGEVVPLSHGGVVFDEGASWRVVLLGWLGAEHKHLKRYAEIYWARGIQAVSFVVPVGEVLRDLGKGVEAKIVRLAGELAAWTEEKEEDGRERRLLFHTFSNTGWYTYGAILEYLQYRGDVLQKIKGCVVDSGAEPDINPQVWAAGFCAALLKKRNSLTHASLEHLEEGTPKNDKNRLMMQAGPDVIELALLYFLEKFFTVVLRLPFVNKRLKKIISILSYNQPSCPQLYLYSSADKVIPVRSVELFIQGQENQAKVISAYNFLSSPHVDHFRTFPHIYSIKIDDFLKECCAAIKL